MLVAQRPRFEEHVAPRPPLCPHVLSIIVSVYRIHVCTAPQGKQRYLSRRMFVLAMSPFWVSTQLGTVETSVGGVIWPTDGLSGTRGQADLEGNQKIQVFIKIQS